MRIVYVGNFEHIHTTENHIRQTLIMMGHEVIALQEHSISHDQVIREANRSQLFMWTKTIGNFNGLTKDIIDKITVPTVSYHLDLYYGLGLRENILLDPFWSTDFAFQPDGSEETMNYFKKHDINAHYLRCGVFGPECYKAAPDKRYDHDVVFVGSYAYHSEWPYRQILIDFLREKYGKRFKRYGYHSADDPDAKNIRNYDLNSLYASAKVVVGDTLCLNNRENYWSDRIYETLGRGGFLIHPYIKGMKEEFYNKEDLVFYEYGDFAQLSYEIDYYLKHPIERKAIRDMGFDKVKHNYTYDKRLEEMFKILRQEGAL